MTFFSDVLASRAGPGEDPECGQVRLEIHVRLFDPDEALDRRPVEHDAAVESLLELPVGDLDVLDGSEDVGELQAEELHLFALGALEDLRLGLAAFRPIRPGFSHGRDSISANF